jgi:hypothetical protein
MIDREIVAAHSQRCYVRQSPQAADMMAGTRVVGVARRKREVPE